MEIKGTIIDMFELESVGNAGKVKQTFILETEGTYPKKIAVEVWNESFEMAIGEKVTLGVNIESREYNGRWYTSVSAWKKDGAGQQQRPAAQPQRTQAQPSQARAPQSNGGTLVQRGAHQIAAMPPIEGDDDLPF